MFSINEYLKLQELQKCFITFGSDIIYHLRKMWDLYKDIKKTEYFFKQTFMSAIESSFWLLLADFWNSSISCFMFDPISPKLRYMFWKATTSN